MSTYTKLNHHHTGFCFLMLFLFFPAFCMSYTSLLLKNINRFFLEIYQLKIKN
ncbi:hypothetical protein ACINWC323_1402 [Acinetobacter sp. WC-323]|nr:hypothetical protein ACINWC323_1402 [Acinetobacter sp. WC-323]